MSEIQKIYLEFLTNFPEGLRPFISIGLAVFLVYSVIKVIKKDFLFIIGLVILLPASKSILENIWQALVSFIKFLLNA